MSGFRYEKPKVKEVHILGKDYVCREPGLQEQVDYERRLKAHNESDDVTEIILDFIEKLGVPKEATRVLPLSEVLNLLAYIRGGDLDKKK